MLAKTAQPASDFDPGDLASGYYNDLRGVALGYGRPDHAAGWLELFARRREQAWPVTILQLGLGAWQLARAGESRWLEISRSVGTWAAVDMDGHGRFAHLQPMPHTFPIDPPWFSAMAQGQGVSLLARLAISLGDDSLEREALRAARPLLDPALGLIAQTDDGPVLQEYPTSEPAHVLNGWIWALWGLYDASLLGDEEAGRAFDAGVRCLAARLPLYDTGRGWSWYDLYPGHPVRNIASPFYHSLHIAQLSATHRIREADEFARTAQRWQAASDSRATRAAAVARKVGFRMMRPRRKAA